MDVEQWDAAQWRQEALNRALDLTRMYAENGDYLPSDAEVIQTAERFRKFLLGETPQETPQETPEKTCPCPNPRLVQHRDGKPLWCAICGLSAAADGEEPTEEWYVGEDMTISSREGR